MLVFLSFYFLSLVLFGFISQPIHFCLLLMFNALSLSGALYFCFNITWYLLLFGLVYVGGVYVLFIFVSVHNPNLISSGFEARSSYLFFLVLCLIIFSFEGCSHPYFSESSYYLCSLAEGGMYCALCLSVVVGFSAVGVVFSRKGSFFR